jgi:hypothetical protein
MSLVVLTSGCAGWYDQFKKNPVAYVDDFMSKTNVIVQGLSVTFDGVLAFLPPEEAAKARIEWQKGIQALSEAEKALHSGVDAAVAAQESTPNFGRLITDVVTAVQNIINIVNIFKVHPAVQSHSPSLSATRIDDPFIQNYILTYGKK